MTSSVASRILARFSQISVLGTAAFPGWRVWGTICFLWGSRLIMNFRVPMVTVSFMMAMDPQTAREENCHVFICCFYFSKLEHSFLASLLQSYSEIHIMPILDKICSFLLCNSRLMQPYWEKKISIPFCKACKATHPSKGDPLTPVGYTVLDFNWRPQKRKF